MTDRRPFRILHYSFGPFGDEGPRADVEHGFVLWPLDERQEKALDLDPMGRTIPTWPEHLVAYGNGPGIVIHWASPVGVTWSVHTRRGSRLGSFDDFTQMEFGMQVGRLVAEQLQQNPNTEPRAMILLIARETGILLLEGMQAIHTGDGREERPVLDHFDEDEDDD